jgi:hypothetical protein
MGHAWLLCDGPSCLLTHCSEANKFQDSRIARFGLIIHTSVPRPDPDLVAATYPLRVMVRG